MIIVMDVNKDNDTEIIRKGFNEEVSSKKINIYWIPKYHSSIKFK